MNRGTGIALRVVSARLPRVVRERIQGAWGWVTGGELRELAAELRGRADKCRGHLLQMVSVSYELAEQAADVLERLADEQEAAQAASSEPEPQTGPGEASPIRQSGDSGSLDADLENPGRESGTAEADAALVRRVLRDVELHPEPSTADFGYPGCEACEALAALDRLLAGKAAG